MPTPAPATSMTADSQLADTLAQLSASRREVAELQLRLAELAHAKNQVDCELRLLTRSLDASPMYFLVLEPNHKGKRIKYVNSTLARAHGYAPDELIGQDVGVLGLRFRSEEERLQLLSLLDAGQVVRIEGQARHRNGEFFWIGFHVVPVRLYDQEITHHVSFGADITARLEADRRKSELQTRLLDEMRERERMAIELRLAHKLESVGRLAAGIAHEINTPIQYVADSVYFLRSAFEDLGRLFQRCRQAVSTVCAKEASVLQEITRIEKEIDFAFLSSEVPRAFERTIEGADRVAHVVRAIKEFAHPDVKDHNPADLNHALQTTLEVARGEYKYLATIETQFGDIPAVICNVGELNQVFLNLIINAAHAIQDSGKDATEGRITISTTAEGDFVHITIADNGCGIPEENLEKMFDPFFTTKDVGRGTGQGLSIARSMIDRHAGHIDVKSQIGVGSQFTLRLPMAGAAARRERR